MKFYLSRIKEHNDRFISRTASALRSWLLTTGPTLPCLCKLFSCEARPGILEDNRTGSETNLDPCMKHNHGEEWSKGRLGGKSRLPEDLPPQSLPLTLTSLLREAMLWGPSLGHVLME